MQARRQDSRVVRQLTGETSGKGGKVKVMFYLPVDLTKRLRAYALSRGTNYSAIATEALETVVPSNVSVVIGTGGTGGTGGKK